MLCCNALGVGVVLYGAVGALERIGTLFGLFGSFFGSLIDRVRRLVVLGLFYLSILGIYGSVSVTVV